MQSRRRAGRKHLFAQRKEYPTAAAREEAEVPDADETAWQHMQQEAAQELIDMESQESLLVLVSRVAPAERNLVI